MTPLRLYNTLTRRKEVFEPLEPGRVRVYSCGPTVYSRQHVGNLRAFLFADLLNRTLRYAGYDVYYVINVTDVGHLTDDEV
jgi:cysteinyl-tRNA synthetase